VSSGVAAALVKADASDCSGNIGLEFNSQLNGTVRTAIQSSRNCCARPECNGLRGIDRNTKSFSNALSGAAGVDGTDGKVKRSNRCGSTGNGTGAGVES